LKNIRILVVEDEHLIALEIKKRLEDIGYKVPKITDKGKEAIEYIEKNKIDLILMDIELNDELNGIDTAEIINSNYDIPVLYLTAYSDDKTLEKAKKTMVYGYIVKPIDENKLKINIEMAINKQKLEKEKTKKEVDNGKKLLEKKKISIKNDDETLLINLDDLVYIEVEEGVVYFFTDNEKLSENGTLKYWEDKLEDYGFYRCHKNYIVELNKVEKLITGKNNTYHLKMSNYVNEIPIARDKIKPIKEIMII